MTKRREAMVKSLANMANVDEDASRRAGGTIGGCSEDLAGCSVASLYSTIVCSDEVNARSRALDAAATV